MSEFSYLNLEPFFYYVNERERIRLKKESGEKWPWTEDPILKEYKFTCVDREDDRTTRWLRENWTVPNEHKPLDVQLMNIATFRYFCTIEFATELGYQDEWNPDLVIATADRMMKAGKKVFTGAFVITNQGISAPKQQVVVRRFLQGLYDVRHKVIEVAQTTKSWEKTAEVVRKVEGYGGMFFMGKELLVDCYHTPILRDCVDRNTWTPAGPGARRGLNRLAGRPVDQSLNERKALAEMKFIYSKLPEYCEPHVDLNKIDLHGIQFIACEVDKRLRVLGGEGRPRAKYRP